MTTLGRERPVVPNRLRVAIEAHSEEELNHQSISWDYGRWEAYWVRNRLPHRDVLVEIHREMAAHGTIRRSFVHAFADRSPERLLITTMAWGFGDRAYGPFRTGLMLTEPARVRAIVAAARVRGAEEAFRALHAPQSHVPRLGTAFGTKLLYFAGYRADARPRPLIYDVNVWRGLLELGLGGFPAPWALTTDRYMHYLGIAERVASDTGRSPDVMEFAMFSLGKSAKEAARRSGKRHPASAK